MRRLELDKCRAACQVRGREAPAAGLDCRALLPPVRLHQVHGWSLRWEWPKKQPRGQHFV